MESFKLKILSSKNIKFKLNTKIKIYGTNLLIFKINKKIKGNKFTFQIDLSKYKRIVQINLNISDITSFYKNGIEYYQQIYKNNIYNEKVILRFNTKMFLKEVIYKF